VPVVVLVAVVLVAVVLVLELAPPVELVPDVDAEVAPDVEFAVADAAVEVAVDAVAVAPDVPVVAPDDVAPAPEVAPAESVEPEVVFAPDVAPVAMWAPLDPVAPIAPGGSIVVDGAQPAARTRSEAPHAATSVRTDIKTSPADVESTVRSLNDRATVSMRALLFAVPSRRRPSRPAATRALNCPCESFSRRVALMGRKTPWNDCAARSSMRVPSVGATCSSTPRAARR
jgi:hypothetical protein